MRYTEDFLDYNYRLKECPSCNNEEFTTGTRFCKICGKDVLNQCEGSPNEYGEEEKHFNPGNARFCEMCGSKTQFFTMGFLKPWEEARAILLNENKVSTNTDDDDLPF